MKFIRNVAVCFLVCLAWDTAPADKDAGATKHFDPQGKPPSTFTLELRDSVKAELPFSDKRDFDEAKKGFIAAPRRV